MRISIEISVFWVDCAISRFIGVALVFADFGLVESAPVREQFAKTIRVPIITELPELGWQPGVLMAVSIAPTDFEAVRFSLVELG